MLVKFKSNDLDRYFFCLSMLFLFASSLYAQKLEKGSMKDERDGKKYRTISINGKIWMLDNLKYESNTSNCYDDDAKKCEKYGKLYSWEVATGGKSGENVQGICPKGWHIPTKQEWDNLYKSLNTFRKRGEGFEKLFNLQFGGLRYDIGKYVEEGKMEIFWSATLKKQDWAWAAYFLPKYVRMQGYEYQTGNAMYCRCVKD
jgi:uncharacterized protein (TIGR02145 family)